MPLNLYTFATPLYLYTIAHRLNMLQLLYLYRVVSAYCYASIALYSYTSMHLVPIIHLSQIHLYTCTYNRYTYIPVYRDSSIPPYRYTVVPLHLYIICLYIYIYYLVVPLCLNTTVNLYTLCTFTPLHRYTLILFYLHTSIP